MKTITIKTQINQPIDLVWSVLVTPEHITHYHFSSEDWHTPKASVDLVENGQFTYFMQAKDESFGFDYGGIYTKIGKPHTLNMKLGYNREVHTHLQVLDQHTTLVTQSFEPEQTFPLEAQEKGWQAILDNLKSYCESLS